MARNKNQHFVPKTHLRRFSSDSNGKSISIINLASDRVMFGASIRGQCAKPYFYGKDLVLEQSMQAPEGIYDQLIRRVEKDESLSRRSRQILLMLSLIQALRTEISITTALKAQNELMDLAFESHPEQKPVYMTQEEAAFQALGALNEFFPLIADLDSCIIKNHTGINLVTSDNPSCAINKLYFNRLPNHAFGLQSAGYCIYMPLTPKYAMFAYDSNVYQNLTDSRGFLSLRDKRDIDILNSMQVLNAMENIYFSDASESGRLLQQCRSLWAARRPERFKLNYAVYDERRSTEEHSVYRVVHTPEERRMAHTAIVSLEAVPLTPRRFPRFLRYKLRPKFVDTRSAAGLIRQAHSDLQP